MFNSYLYDLCARFAVGCAAGVVLWSLVYPLSIRSGFGYQHLFCHALPSHFVFPLPAGFFCLLDYFEQGIVGTTVDAEAVYSGRERENKGKCVTVMGVWIGKKGSGRRGKLLAR